jgi:hypothetical protein
MKKLIGTIAVVAFLGAGATGCTTTDQNTANGAGIGAVAGGVIGGVASGTAGGVLAGAAIGGVAGAMIGAASSPGNCYYRDRYGRRYVADCPSGYHWHRSGY